MQYLQSCLDYLASSRIRTSLPFTMTLSLSPAESEYNVGNNLTINAAWTNNADGRADGTYDVHDQDDELIGSFVIINATGSSSVGPITLTRNLSDGWFYVLREDDDANYTETSHFTVTP